MNSSYIALFSCVDKTPCAVHSHSRISTQAHTPVPSLRQTSVIRHFYFPSPPKKKPTTKNHYPFTCCPPSLPPVKAARKVMTTQKAWLKK